MKLVVSSRLMRRASVSMSSICPWARKRPRAISGVVLEAMTSNPPLGMAASKRRTKSSAGADSSVSKSSRKIAKGGASAASLSSNA
ncbi:hypothetical protein D3C76_1027740 [compost metagenome]